MGGGPTGLVVALTLLKNDVPVRIIEKDAEFHRGIRGTSFQVSSYYYFSMCNIPIGIVIASLNRDIQVPGDRR